jgi:hypothetical protein
VSLVPSHWRFILPSHSEFFVQGSSLGGYQSNPVTAVEMCLGRFRCESRTFNLRNCACSGSLPIAITASSININTSYFLASADIWVYLGSAWSWCRCIVRSSKSGGHTFQRLSIARSSSSIEPRGHITPVLLVHSIIIRLSSYVISRSSRSSCSKYQTKGLVVCSGYHDAARLI